MEFLKIEYLYLMLIPAMLFFYLIVTKQSGIKEIFDEKILKKLKFDNNSLGLMGRNIFLFLALFFMIIALARPVSDKKEIIVNPTSYDLLVGIDVSKSMKANDLYPNRFLFAKEKFKKLLEYFKDANIGLIAFSNNAFLVSPLTPDFYSLEFLIDNLDIDSLSTAGTDFIPPIETANRFLEKNSQKILLLFTDGGDNSDFKLEIARAKDYGINIYVYALGDKKGSTIKEDGEFLKDKNNNIVISKLNENIKNLAIKTRGAYVMATTNDEGLKLLIEDIQSKFQKTLKKSQKITTYNELFYIPLFCSILFILIAFSSLPKRFNKSNFILLLFLLFSYESKVNALILDFKDIKEANRAYLDKDYKKAIKKYEEIVNLKKSPQSYYNLANAYYKNKAYKKALENYSKIISDDLDIKYKKLHNMGNSYMQLKDYKHALESYENALKIKKDEDTIFNRDLAKKLLNKKNNQNKKNQNKNDKNKDKEEEKNQQNNKNEDKNKDENKTTNESNKKQQDKTNNQQDKNDKNKDNEEEKNQQNNKNDAILSDIEEKKWDRKLQDQQTKIKPLIINTRKSRQNENYW